MLGYRRPVVSSAVFLDGAGNEIAYGSRWGEGGPPDNSYSVTSNLKRFQPIQDVADALVEWLTRSYDVQIIRTATVASDLLHRRDDVTRAVRITPSHRAAAPVTFVYTSFPSVIIHAGELHDFPFPFCGCDACDESWESAVDELEWTVLTIVRGGYRERIEPDKELGVHYSLVEPGISSRSGQNRATDYPPDRLEHAVANLPEAAWAAWEPRDDT